MKGYKRDEVMDEWVGWAKSVGVECAGDVECGDAFCGKKPCWQHRSIALAAQRLAEEVREEAARMVETDLQRPYLEDAIRALPLPPKEGK